jgi:hypothetical protein
MLQAIKNPKKLFAVAFVAATCCLMPATAAASIFISVRIGPPALPVYVQPPCPVSGYLWTPGYWAYGPIGYYWVPGVWIAPPSVGVLWTPGYWGFGGGIYSWHTGYWGPHVGFYGGVNYGFGYGGFGFVGGVWSGGAFRYNTAVVNVNTAVVRNVYVDRTVINNTTIVNNRVSFNGPDGVMAQPTPQERAYEHEQHFQPTPSQFEHERTAGVRGRAMEQQQRIGQGVAHGQLSPGQTGHIERQEQNINHQVHADRQGNGGKLTPQEHRQVNREQNHASREIHEAREKHER